MTLKEYQKKRKFEKTSEPKGSDKVTSDKAIKKDLSHRHTVSLSPIFVVHDHHARQHHHDLRLEIRSVLKSWAIPKLTPLKPDIKRLAIQVEDHPIEYAKFTGTIPEGQYGAGEVKIFDKGTYKIVNETLDSLEFVLEGKKVKGLYVLIRLKNNPKNWLLFKK